MIVFQLPIHAHSSCLPAVFETPCGLKDFNFLSLKQNVDLQFCPEQETVKSVLGDHDQKPDPSKLIRIVATSWLASNQLKS